MPFPDSIATILISQACQMHGFEGRFVEDLRGVGDGLSCFSFKSPFYNVEKLGKGQYFRFIITFTTWTSAKL